MSSSISFILGVIQEIVVGYLPINNIVVLSRGSQLQEPFNQLQEIALKILSQKPRIWNDSLAMHDLMFAENDLRLGGVNFPKGGMEIYFRGICATAFKHLKLPKEIKETEFKSVFERAYVLEEYVSNHKEDFREICLSNIRSRKKDPIDFEPIRLIDLFTKTGVLEICKEEVLKEVESSQQFMLDAIRGSFYQFDVPSIIDAFMGIGVPATKQMVTDCVLITLFTTFKRLIKNIKPSQENLTQLIELCSEVRRSKCVEVIELLLSRGIKPSHNDIELAISKKIDSELIERLVQASGLTLESFKLDSDDRVDEVLPIVESDEQELIQCRFN